jgi:hypothetical protein
VEVVVLIHYPVCFLRVFQKKQVVVVQVLVDRAQVALHRLAQYQRVEVVVHHVKRGLPPHLVQVGMDV